MGQIIPITMPKFGLAMTEGKIASWAKPEGVEIDIGDEIADIETTKITNAYESPVKGTLRRHIAPEQEDLPVGALIAIVADASVSDAEITAFVEQFQADFAAQASVATESVSPAPVMLDIGGQTIRYFETGAEHESRPIVLVHGFGGDLNNWLFNQEALSETQHVISIDLPGHGGSSKDVGAGDLAALSEALVAFLDAMEIPKAHLVGHSLGGAVALRVAIDKPAHIASLTLIAPAGFGTAIDGSFISGFIEAGRRKQLEAVLAKLFHDKNLVSREMTEDLLKYKRLDGVRTALETIARACFGNGHQTELLRHRLDRLGNISVQVIWGEDDEIIPSSHAAGLPSSIRMQVLAGAGHMPQMEKATEVNRLILEQAAR